MIYKKELLDWIDLDKLDWNNLSLNSSAIELLKNNLDKINWKNLATNENGYFIIKDNIYIFNDKNYKYNKEIREYFIKNSPFINLFEINYDNLDDDSSNIFYNSYAKKHIDKIECKNIYQKLFLLMRYKNKLFPFELEKYIREECEDMDKEIDKETNKETKKQKYYDKTKKFFDLFMLESCNMYDIPNTEIYKKIFFNNYCDDRTNELDIHIISKKEYEIRFWKTDFYKLNEFKYSFDKKHIENGIRYILYGYGSIHNSNNEHYINTNNFSEITIKNNMKEICDNITSNKLFYSIIEHYIDKVNDIYEQFYLYCLFYAISSKEDIDAIRLLEKYPNYINWSELSRNSYAIHLLEKNIEKIDWLNLSLNKNIFKCDYEKKKNNNLKLHNELIHYIYNPERLINICKKYDIKFNEYLENI